VTSQLKDIELFSMS